MKNKEIIKKVLKGFEDKKGWSEIVDGALRNEYMIRMDVEWALEKALALKNKKFEEFIKLIKEWTFKNNTIKFKNSNLGLAVLDGGWVNVIELHNEINKLSGLKEEEN